MSYPDFVVDRFLRNSSQKFSSSYIPTNEDFNVYIVVTVTVTATVVIAWNKGVCQIVCCVNYQTLKISSAFYQT